MATPWYRRLNDVWRWGAHRKQIPRIIDHLTHFNHWPSAGICRVREHSPWRVRCCRRSGVDGHQYTSRRLPM